LKKVFHQKSRPARSSCLHLSSAGVHHEIRSFPPPVFVILLCLWIHNKSRSQFWWHFVEGGHFV
jgi:hypothetical protein